MPRFLPALMASIHNIFIQYYSQEIDVKLLDSTGSNPIQNESKRIQLDKEEKAFEK